MLKGAEVAASEESEMMGMGKASRPDIWHRKSMEQEISYAYIPIVASRRTSHSYLVMK
jgi:hypothetical protein